jgi:porin
MDARGGMRGDWVYGVGRSAHAPQYRRPHEASRADMVRVMQAAAFVVMALGAQDAPAAPGPLAWQWIPKSEAKLAPYLEGVNTWGSECLQPGSLFASDPVSDAAQAVKTALAEVGIFYRLDNSYSFIAMSDVARGESVLNYYNMQLLASWVVFDSVDLGGTTGWVTLQANAGVGLGFDMKAESPQQNIGMVTWANYGWVTADAYLSELAWAQSFLDGSLVVRAGFVDPTIPVDANSYANNQYGQLMNWAFVNSQVLPYAFGSLGTVVQWQPAEWVYAMVSTGANNTPSGRPPWYAVSGDNWSTIFELGLVSQDTLGLGPGVLRVQPFAATVRGDWGGGIAFNVEQSLSRDLPLAVFGRFGVGDSVTSRVNGAAVQMAGGLALRGTELGGRAKLAVDYGALGFAWTQVDNATATHPDEFVIEATVVYNLTPTLAIQPDVQVVWDPAFGPSSSNVIGQVQLVFTW